MNKQMMIYFKNQLSVPQLLVRKKFAVRFLFVLSLLVLSSLGMGNLSPAFADAPAVPAGSSAGAPAAPASNQQPGGLMNMVPFLAMFGVLYFFILRPQQKKIKEQQQMLTSLKHGDEIVTTSGILGKVSGITDKVVTLEIADNVKVKMLKSQVSQVIKGSVKDLTG